MENLIPVLWVVLGIAIFVFLNVKLKVHNLLGLLIVGLFVAIAEGMDFTKICTTVQNGLGSVFGSLAIIVVFGAVIAKFMSDSGASQRIADTVIDKCGEKFLPFGLMFIGIIFGIAMFYEVAFLMAVPLVLSIAKKAKVPYMYLIIPIVTGCTMGHSVFPPQPGPVALVSAFEADISQVYIFGFIVVIPTVICSGWILPKFIPGIKKIPNNSVLAPAKEIPEDKLPSFATSIFIPLIPMILMVGASVASQIIGDGNTQVKNILTFIGSPIVSMLIAFLASMFLLGAKRGMNIEQVSKTVSSGVKDIAEMVIIICAGGILKQVIIDAGVADNIVNLVSTIPVSPFIIAWLITVFIRILTGQGAVAAITAAGIVAPLVTQYGLNPALMVVGVACGSNTITLMYDGGFLLFKESFGISMKDTFKTWGLLELTNSVVGLIIVLVLSMFITG